MSLTREEIQLFKQLVERNSRLGRKLALLDTHETNLSGLVLTSGTNPLTADWDLGEDRAILAERLRARDIEGLTLYDDGGNPGVVVLDGGGVSLANGGLVISPAVSGVGQSTFGGQISFFGISPGSASTSQTWTVEVTTTLTGQSRGGVFQLVIYGQGATSPSTVRLYYVAWISWYRVNAGDTAVITVLNELVKDVVGCTITGPTAIANGVRFVVAPTAASLSRLNGSVMGNIPGAAVSSVVA